MKSKINVFTTSILVLFLTIGMSSYAQNADQDSKKDAKKEKRLEKKRKKFESNKSKALKEMYKAYPKSKAALANSYGYAAFANLGLYLSALSSGNGGGKAHNNVTGKEVFVKMISYGAGLGIGAKKYFAVFLFRDKAAFNSFLKSGWSAEGAADATADTGIEGVGESYAVGMPVADGVTLYQIADKGLALQATVQGTKFIVSDELNGTAN